MKAYYKQKRLSEQVVVITGGSSGIGLATAKMAGSRGARLVITSNNDTELEQARDLLDRAGYSVESRVADVSDYEALESVAELAIERFGRIDTWINNAGIHTFGKLREMNEEDMRRVFDVNYWGAVYGSRIAARHLSGSGGTLINIGSVLSSRSIPLQGIYGASKHALEGYTDALRMELEKQQLPVIVTLIKPSSINTPIPAHSKNLMAERARLPFPLYDPDVAADAILFCAENPRRSFIIGGVGKLAVLGEKFVPSVVDKAMEWFAWDMQKSRGEPRNEDAIHEPLDQEPSTHGEDSHYTKTFSLYNSAIKNPLVTTGLLTLASASVYYYLNADGEG